MATNINRQKILSRKVFGTGSNTGLPTWDPIDEGCLVAWYKNKTGITLNGSDVREWADASLNTYNMTQGVTIQQPAYNAFNGFMTFDGIDNTLTSSQMNFTGACTIGIRGSFSSAADGTLIGDSDLPAVTAFISFFTNDTLRIRTTAGPLDFTLPSGTFGDDYLVITRDAALKTAVYRNGVMVGTPATRTGNIKIDAIGARAAGDYLVGKIGEIQIYNCVSDALTDHINTRLSEIIL